MHGPASPALDPKTSRLEGRNVARSARGVRGGCPKFVRETNSAGFRNRFNYPKRARIKRTRALAEARRRVRA